MSMSDPIADMLTRIRNANVAKHDTVAIPSSKIKVSIAQILKDEGFISDFEIKGEGVQKEIVISLKYLSGKSERALTGLKKISKPGLRIYASAENLPKVLGGLGIAIISTNEGVLTDKEAREKNVGGEVLAYIW